MGAEDMLGDHFAGLAGDVQVQVSDQHAWGPGPPVVLVEQDLGVARYAGWVAVSEEMLDDAAPVTLAAAIGSLLDRHLRPWLFPDQPAWPTVVVLPSLARAQGLAGEVVAVASEARRRARAAWSALRWGVPDVEDWDDAS